MNCKHFGIIHPSVNLYNSNDATPEQREGFVKAVIITHGFCLLTEITNPVTGVPDKRLAIHERNWGDCGPEGKNFEAIVKE